MQLNWRRIYVDGIAVPLIRKVLLISKLVMTWVGKEKVLVKHITVAQGCCFDTDRKRKDLELWDTN